MTPSLSFDLTPETRPILIRAGIFDIADRDFETQYRLDNLHALHLYLYHCRIRFAGEEYRINPGDITVTPAGIATGYALDSPPGEHLCLHFELPPGNALMINFLTKARLAGPSLPVNFREIIALFRDSRHPESWVAAENLLTVMLYQLHRLSQNEQPADSRMEELLDYLDRNFRQPLPIKALARRFCLSQTHLTRKFKEHTHTTIAQYVMRRRIDLAGYLLSTSNQSIKEIGLTAGYATPQEFNKRFRQVTGESPSTFRRHARQPGVLR